MPIYAMHCPACGAQQDIYRRIAEMDNDLPQCCGQAMQRRMCAPFVRGDLPAYQAVAMDQKTGRAPVIEGRAQHREFLKRNGYVEAPDIKPRQREEVRGDFNVRKDLAEATKRVLSQPGHTR